MKLKVLLLIAVLAVAHVLPGQITFDKKYKLGYNNTFTSHPLTGKDSTYTFLHYARDSASNRLDFGLARIDKTGGLILSKSFNVKNKDYLTHYGLKHFLEASPSSYFVAGTMAFGSKYGSVFSKVSALTLDTICVKSYTQSNWNMTMLNLMKIRENKYYLVGTKWDNDTWPYFLELDSSLSLVNSLQVNTTAHISSEAIFNPVNRRLLLGSRFAHSATVHFLNIGLMEVDTLGAITNTYMSTSTYSFFVGTIYFSQPDSSYVVVGGQQTLYYNGYSRSRMNISKYDMDLKCLWRKSYADDNEWNELWAATILPDGSIVACGRYSETAMNNYNGVLLKVDRNGVPQWMREYDHIPATATWHEVFLGVEQTLDGGFIVVGDVYLEPQGTAWVIKTDSMGCVTPGCPTSSVTVDSLLLDPAGPGTITAVSASDTGPVQCQVYPNPSSGHFIIKVAGTPGTLNFEIADALGSVVVTGHVDQAHQAEVGKDLSPGIYLLRLRSETGQVVHRQKIVRK